MNLYKKTIAKGITLSGLGLHSGVPVEVMFTPGNQGLRIRILQGDWIPLSAEQVTHTQRCTQLGPISTVEHLMSALAGLQITDLDISLTSGEFPALDGSALPYIEALLEADITDLKERVKRFEFEPLYEEYNNAWVAVKPGSGKFEYTYDIGSRWPGKQIVCFTFSPEFYQQEIAPARTFGLEEELPMIQAAGLAKGLDFSSAVVLGKEGYLNPVRFPDEPARHKLLDLIGDLYLSGIPMDQVDVKAYKSGHALHTKVALALSQSLANLV